MKVKELIKKEIKKLIMFLLKEDIPKKEKCKKCNKRTYLFGVCDNCTDKMYF